MYSQKVGKKKKLSGKLLSVLLFALLCGVGFVASVASPVYATTVDLTPLTDMLPTIIEIMVFSMVLGLIGGLMRSMSGGFGGRE